MANKKDSVKKFYWLKLKEEFFEDDTINFIEEQENGKEYLLFYLKLCLKSLKKDGHLYRLVGNKAIPYDVKSLATLTNTNIDTVNSAMVLFKHIGVIDVLDTGMLYMSQINEMIGSETSKAQLMRDKRARDKLLGINKKEDKKPLGNNVTGMLPHIEEEKETQTDTKTNTDTKNGKFESSIELISTLEPERQLILKEWLEYKKSKNQSYTKVGLKKLISTIEEFSNIELKTALDSSISNNYAGLFPKHTNKPKSNFYRADSNTPKEKINQFRVLEFSAED